MTALAGGSAQAAPFRPADDAMVLERLPAAPQRGTDRTDVQAAVQQARNYIERARRDGDPRWLGYAQGVLQPWWSLPLPPQPVLLLRATLLQSRHQFDAALDDLALLLQRDPTDAQARLTQATVLRVQGRFAEAGAACLKLLGSADDFVTRLCATAIEGLHGSLPEALQRLEAMEVASAAQAPGIQSWYWAERSEMLERAGRPAAAETAYRHALQIDPGDLGLRIAYADFLLDQRRPAEALALARATTAGRDADSLRLRQVLAQQALGSVNVHLRAAVADGFAAARRRGEELHLREEARYTLDIVGDAPRALALAQQNWDVQHEPWDARLLLAAARAAAQPQAAQPLLHWLQQTGFEDARLQPWLTAR